MCSSTLWTGYLKTWKSKEELAGGTGGEDPGSTLYTGAGVRVSQCFLFLSSLESKAGSQESCATVAENQGKFHLFNQKTRKTQAGEYGGRSPPPSESWVNGTG